MCGRITVKSIPAGHLTLCNALAFDTAMEDIQRDLGLASHPKIGSLNDGVGLWGGRHLQKSRLVA